MLSEPSTQQDKVLDCVCRIEQDLVVAVAAMDKLSLAQAQCVSEVLELCNSFSGQLEQFQILAEHRDYISRFRGHVLALVSQQLRHMASWEQLSWALMDEELLPEPDRVATTAVLEALRQMGFTWAEWCHLRIVADAGVALMHQGARTRGGMQGALQRLRTEPVPRGLEGCKQALLKALDYSIKAAQPMHGSRASEVSNCVLWCWGVLSMVPVRMGAVQVVCLLLILSTHPSWDGLWWRF